MCIESLSPLDYQFSMGNLVATPETCNTPHENMAGVWTGTYSCDNTPCSDDDDEEITLTITQSQNGYSGHYEDSEAVYDGTICGNEFRFNGGVTGEFGGYR